MREELFKNMSPDWVAGQAAVHQLRVRGSVDEKQVLDFVGEVEGHVGVILDDMMRSGSTMFQAAKAAKEKGAKKVIGLVTHFYGFDSETHGRFDERLADSPLDELICTNSRGGLEQRLRAPRGHEGLSVQNAVELARELLYIYIYIYIYSGTDSYL